MSRVTEMPSMEHIERRKPSMYPGDDDHVFSKSFLAHRLSRESPTSVPNGYDNDETAAVVTERQPTYVGYIKTPADAILLLAACDLSDDSINPQIGPHPRRISHRLLDDERNALVRSGSIFVWDEREAGMRRWTDGRCWSASRVSGCFLTYRELEMRKKNSESTKEGPRNNLYKPDGLVKQSFSITTSSNRKLHVISYFRKNDVRMGLLRRVSEDPRIVGRGPNTWGVRVDKNEYGDLLMRENETLPEGMMHGMPSSKRLDTPAETYRGIKRAPSEVDSDSDIPSMNHVTSRSFDVYQREGDYFTCGNTLYYSDEIPFKRYRYESQYNLPYCYRRSWTPRWGNSPVSAPASPMAMSYHPTVAPYSKTQSPICQSPTCYYPRTIPCRAQPPICPTDAEQDSLEALASLRSSANASRLAPMPPIEDYNPSRYRSRVAPVSITDRFALKKLSVPI